MDPHLAFTVSSSAGSAGQVTIEVVANGSGSHTFALRTSNVRIADGSKTVVLKSGSTRRLTWTGTIEMRNSP